MRSPSKLLFSTAEQQCDPSLKFNRGSIVCTGTVGLYLRSKFNAQGAGAPHRSESAGEILIDGFGSGDSCSGAQMMKQISWRRLTSGG
ncbi:MAG: hypothetical protein JNJ88_03425 [Planctomycetes bacterium]|nr:hypothetical protein [Planctomycetota bacterium]